MKLCAARDGGDHHLDATGPHPGDVLAGCAVVHDDDIELAEPGLRVQRLLAASNIARFVSMISANALHQL